MFDTYNCLAPCLLLEVLIMNCSNSTLRTHPQEEFSFCFLLLPNPLNGVFGIFAAPWHHFVSHLSGGRPSHLPHPLVLPAATLRETKQISKQPPPNPAKPMALSWSASPLTPLHCEFRNLPCPLCVVLRIRIRGGCHQRESTDMSTGCGFHSWLFAVAGRVSLSPQSPCPCPCSDFARRTRGEYGKRFT